MHVFLVIHQQDVIINKCMKNTPGFQVMLMFVVVYIIQYFVYVVQALWSLAETPSGWIYVPAVLLCNAGGVYNFIAYTVIRKKYVFSKTNPNHNVHGKMIKHMYLVYAYVKLYLMYSF